MNGQLSVPIHGPYVSFRCAEFDHQIRPSPGHSCVKKRRTTPWIRETDITRRRNQCGSDLTKASANGYPSHLHQSATTQIDLGLYQRLHHNQTAALHSDRQSWPVVAHCGRTRSCGEQTTNLINIILSHSLQKLHFQLVVNPMVLLSCPNAGSPHDSAEMLSEGDSDIHGGPPVSVELLHASFELDQQLANFSTPTACCQVQRTRLPSLAFNWRRRFQQQVHHVQVTNTASLEHSA
mmetsp:Transcript_60589/g.139829  ORF Transcript_60589/g.139829 Transcript_60589/m.139829 type:complete len:236 (-) Transcript_60589:1794-2501(-)